MSSHPETKVDKATKGTFFLIVNAVLPVVLGGVIYCLFRPDTYISKAVGGVFGFGVPNITTGQYVPLILFAENHLCDMLWAYALVFALTLVTGRSKADTVTASVLSFSCGIFLELLQKKHIITGTFDCADILLEAAACLAACIFINIYFRRYNKNEKDH